MAAEWGTVREAWVAIDDDGSQPSSVIAEKIGCSPSAVRYYRRRAESRQYVDGHEVCTRCDFAESERCPIVTAEVEERLAEVLVGEPAEVQEGLCLWCWLTLQGVDHREFYVSGAWQWVIDWRPDESVVMQFCDDVREVVEERNATAKGAADAIGIRTQRMQQVMDRLQVRLDEDEVEAICQWAGLDPNAYHNLAR